MTDYLSVGPANKWNYSNPNEPGFSPTLAGTLVEVIVKQSRNFHTKQLEYWDDGNPKIGYQFIIKDSNGNEWPWTFDRGGVAYKAVVEAIHATGYSSIEDLGGKMLEISTSGLVTVDGRPTRQWTFTILGDGSYPYRGSKDQVPKGQPQAPAAPANPGSGAPVPAGQAGVASQAQPAGAPPIQGGYYAPPTVAPAPQAVPATPVPGAVAPSGNAVGAVPVPNQVAPVPQAAPAPAAPAAMPAPAQAEQVPTSIYDQNIPF